MKLSRWYYPIGFMLVMWIIIKLVCFSDNRNTIRFDIISKEEEPYEAEIENNSWIESCDFFNGYWVYDEKSRPLYRENECPFMGLDYSCQKNGRKDIKYQFWRWQPHGCDLPRFNGTALLEELKGKRVVLVGDSLGRNFWVSLVCLISSWIPEPSHKVSNVHGSFLTFMATEYNVSIDFYWEPLLVESNCDNLFSHRIRNRIMKIESIEIHAKHWIDADMLIFDSYAWWFEANMTLVWGSFENPDKTYVATERVKRYEMALRTWSNWLDLHINRTKTKLFFLSLSPDHPQGKDWGKSMGENCFNETEPIMEEGHWGSSVDTRLMRTAESVIYDLQNKGLPIEILNITQLSQYRKDGHPSIYRPHYAPPTEDELANPVLHSDCLHWCLPGVPDVWSEILYTYILYKL